MIKLLYLSFIPLMFLLFYIADKLSVYSAFWWHIPTMITIMFFLACVYIILIIIAD